MLQPMFQATLEQNGSGYTPKLVKTIPADATAPAQSAG
jgi:hypothetical protein